MINPYIWIFSLGHLIIDLGQGFLPIITPLLAEKLDLSFFQIGTLAFAFTFSSAIVQPIFGVVSDRLSMPWLMPAGLFISGVGMAMTGLVNSYTLLIFAVLLSGLGVAGYHPESSKMTNLVSQEGRAGASMSIFSVGGNLGFALGPMLAVLVLSFAGLNSVPLFIIPGLLATVLFLFLMPKFKGILDEKLPKDKKIIEKGKEQPTAINSDLDKVSHPQVKKRYLFFLIFYVTIRSWIHAGLIYFIPFYFPQFKGITNPELLVTIFLISGVLGTLLGGPFADRFGERRGLLVSMIASLLCIYPFVHFGGIWVPIFAFILGTFLISTFSITVVFGQKLLPNNIGLASGLVLGFGVGMGSVGVSWLGVIADTVGLPTVMNILCLLPLAGIALAFTLPDKLNKNV